MAGNSASATNNHVELFRKIRDQVDLSERKIIVPLSYGDICYRDKVIVDGKKILGNAFMPLVDFMPIGEYHKIISSCQFVVMNHLRQQALGNICSGLLAGAKIYLNNKNPLMNWFENKGAYIGCIDDIDMIPLSGYEKNVNRSIVFSGWSTEVQNKKTINLIDKIYAHSA